MPSAATCSREDRCCANAIGRSSPIVRSRHDRRRFLHPLRAECTGGSRKRGGPLTPDEYCQQKAAQSGSSFYYSFRLLPPPKRRAITALYAFCREVDDIVDE